MVQPSPTRPRRRATHRSSTVLAVGAAVLLVAACGGGDGSGGTTATGGAEPATPPTASTPTSADPSAAACEDVWVPGATLPRRYTGCVEDGTTVPRDVLGCSSGQRLVRWGTFYAVLGGVVQEGTDPLDDDPGWTDTVRTCRG